MLRAVTCQCKVGQGPKGLLSEETETTGQHTSKNCEMSFFFFLAICLHFFQPRAIGSALYECTGSKLSKCISYEPRTEAQTQDFSTLSFRSPSASLAVPIVNLTPYKTFQPNTVVFAQSFQSSVLALLNALEKQIS